MTILDSWAAVDLDATVTALTDFAASVDHLGSSICTYSASMSGGAWNVSGQLRSYRLSELEQIDAIREWARILNGTVQLADVTDLGTGTFRTLSAVANLGQITFTVWAHIDRTGSCARDVSPDISHAA